MRIKVIVPVSTNIWNEMIREAYEKYKDPDTEITVVNIKKGPESIECTYDATWAELEALLEAEKAEEEGYDAVIDYCHSDPGLIAMKEKLEIPVVGLHEASIHLASMLGRKFSIVTVGGENVKGPKLDRVRLYGLENKLASVRSVDIKVLDIKKDFNKLVDALYQEAKKAITEDGADVIVLGCGSLLGV
ncbi:MAG: hydrogenase expression protein HupH, partial [Thermoprotei archaeon]